MTHQVGDATETDIANYNSFVQGEINTTGHGSIRPHSGSCNILGSTAAVHADDNTDTRTGDSVPIYWLNGAKVADDNADFYDSTWTNKANAKNETGRDKVVVSTTRVWTGS